MKQEKGSKNCVAVVACMATGCTIFDVNNFLGYNTAEKGISDYDFYRFMLSMGYVVGIGIEAHFDEGLLITSIDSELTISYKVKSFPAYIIVQSETNPEFAHAVYFDGNKIWDPNPSAKDGRDISEYTVYRWFPIIKAENRTAENTKPQFEITEEKVIG